LRLEISDIEENNTGINIPYRTDALSGRQVRTVPKLIEACTEIHRTPQEVFDFLSDPARLPEWQPTVDDAAFETNGPPTVGARGHEVRRVSGGRRTISWEVTECEPGSRWSVRGIDGPVRAHLTVGLAPSGAGTSTRVDYGIWFEGHGIGKVVRLLASQGARKELPGNLALLKQRLEGDAPPAP
jgi:uncharacterized protein YndB with AHSA1/START domain